MNPRTAFPFLMALVAASSCGQNSQVLPKKSPGGYHEVIRVGGKNRGFSLQVPKAYDGVKRLPLVVLLHGWGGSASEIDQATGFPAKADAEGFFLATPQGLGQIPGWNVGYMDLSGQGQDDVALLTAMISKIEQEVGVDGQRIYLVGFSNGAMLAHYAGSKLADQIAAIAAVSGTIGMPGISGKPPTEIPKPAEPLSVLMIHGKMDNMVAYQAGSQALLMSIGAEEGAKWWASQDLLDKTPKISRQAGREIEIFSKPSLGVEVELVSIDKGGHIWPADATDLIWSFLAAHPKA